MGGHTRFVLRQFCHSILAAAFGAALAGCDIATFPGLDNALSAGGGLVGDRASLSEESAVNDAFDTAQPVALPEEGEITIDGTIDGKGDIDIYDLGAVQSGDRVSVDVTGKNGINLVAALFDGDRNLIDANDDRNYYAGQIDPYITYVIRRSTDRLYVAIAVTRATHFASPAGRYDQGEYRLRIIRRGRQTVAQARQQVVWLDFRGGASVQISLQPFQTMRAFSAESISARFSGRTEEMIDRIVARMREDFADFDIVLLDGRYDAPPALPSSKLYFGNYNAAYLGLSDSVDTNNAYLDQEGIVYTEDFALFEGLLPSLEEIAQAIANTGSHELGHLVGLEHAMEAADIMATAASARQILETDCQFRRSRLESGVFPTGWQSGYELIMFNVGPGEKAASTRRASRDSGLLPSRDTSKDWRDAIDVRIPSCGSCKDGACGAME